MRLNMLLNATGSAVLVSKVLLKCFSKWWSFVASVIEMRRIMRCRTVLVPTVRKHLYAVVYVKQTVLMWVLMHRYVYVHRCSAKQFALYMDCHV